MFKRQLIQHIKNAPALKAQRSEQSCFTIWLQHQARCKEILSCKSAKSARQLISSGWGQFRQLASRVRFLHPETSLPLHPLFLPFPPPHACDPIRYALLRHQAAVNGLTKRITYTYRSVPRCLAIRSSMCSKCDSIASLNWKDHPIDSLFTAIEKSIYLPQHWQHSRTRRHQSVVPSNNPV